MGKLLVALCAILLVSVSSAYELEGAKLFRVEQHESKEVQKVIAAKMDTLQLQFNIDFWTEPRYIGATDFLVTPEQHEFVTSYLKSNGIQHKVVMEDVGAVIEQQRISREATVKQSSRLSWTEYYNVEAIHQFIDEIAAEHPDIAKVISIGTSTEGRDLKLIKIGTPGEGKPALWIDGGIHAREWIAPAISTYVINQLLNNRTANQDILDTTDWYILAPANPDGYEFTHTNTRMWRKTRSDHDSPLGCLGVDPNRNFEHEWGGPGTSDNKCSDIYKGPSPFSEPETKAMRDFIVNAQEDGVNWKVYFAVHSYAQMWLTPWGYTYDFPEDYPELRALGILATNALTAVHGTPYQVGTVTEILSPGAGGSDDWAKGSGVFKFSQTVEVRDTGRYGFLLPPEQIIPCSEETWASFQAVARFIAENPASSAAAL